jgi:hypothetical protein
MVLDICSREAAAKQLSRALPLWPVRGQEALTAVRIQSRQSVGYTPITCIRGEDALKVVRLARANCRSPKRFRLKGTTILFIALEENWQESVLGEHLPCLEEKIKAEDRIFVRVLLWWSASIFTHEAIVLLDTKQTVGDSAQYHTANNSYPARHCRQQSEERDRIV